MILGLDDWKSEYSAEKNFVYIFTRTSPGTTIRDPNHEHGLEEDKFKQIILKTKFGA